MRPLLLATTLVAALHAAEPVAQEPQRFRGGVDLITVDVSAVDSKGRPIEGLKAGDFVVKVDGKPRPIVSAELIKVERGKPAAPATPANALISSNDMSRNARRIIVAVDQTLIAPGMIAPLQRSAAQFVDRLRPDDYAAFVAFPEPGPRVDFTTDKARVRKVMEGIIGQPARIFSADFNIGLWEAFTITGAEGTQASSVTPQSGPPPPTVQRVLERGCRGMTLEELLESADPNIYMQCRRDIYTEAMNIARSARIDATISMRALEGLLRDLALLEGPKSMIVFSAGLVNEDPTLLNEAARLAALARTTINVIAVEPERNQELRNVPGQSLTFSPSASQGGLALIDRAFELAGLEIIADRTNGTLYRGVAAGNGIFERLESELSAWYLVAVERQPGDPDTQRVEVDIKRRGVTLRTNRNAVSITPSTRRPLDELLNEALSSPFTMPGLPVRLSTFVQRDTDRGRYRVRLAAEIGQPGEPAGEFALGYVLTDQKGRVVTSAGSRRPLAPAASGPNQTLQYETSLSVAPGSYQLRFGVVDKDARRGTLVHHVELPAIADAEIQTSDLIVGNLPAEGETLVPRVEPQITTSELAGYLELYLPDKSVNVTVSLEIAEGEASPALATQPLPLRPGEQASSQVAAGFVSATMTPGRYVARATISRNGVVVKTLSRPFTLVRDPAVVSRATTRTRGVPITTELKQRTAAYIGGVVNGLANVVALEEFELSKPDRRVTSDLLLVRYPGRPRDLIPYRDVAL